MSAECAHLVLLAEEGQILFAPTYRYKRGTREAYDSKKQKVSLRPRVGCRQDTNPCLLGFWNQDQRTFVHGPGALEVFSWRSH